ncbi:MAG: ATP-binding protein [Candidatus Hodarchaeales archaeon]
MEEFFRQFSFFDDFTDSELEQLSKLVKPLKLPKDGILLNQGEAGKNIYFLKEGGLEVYISGHFIDSHKSPSVMGEMEFFDKKPNIATVQANADSFLYFLSYKKFETFLDKHPSIYRKLVSMSLAKWRNVEYGAQNIIKSMSENNKNLSEFASIVSHDLKSPLQTIMMYTELLKSDSDIKSKKKPVDYLNRIDTNIRKMDQLIEGILKYSRAIHSSPDDFNEIDIKEIIKDVLPILSIGKSVKITIKDPMPIIRANKIQLIQVFQNLISNALKFLDKPKKTITIECESIKDFWKFSVTDNGVGIKKEDFPRVMQMFKTLDQEGIEKGTGIGLAIVERIVLMHGGKLWIESEFGKGSTFYFTISKTVAQYIDQTKLMDNLK